MIPSSERRAFDAFVADSADPLLRTAYLLCGDRGHAEDLVQTALLRVARRWPSVRDNPQAYARQIVVNLAKDRWRLLRRRANEVPLEDRDDAVTGRIETDTTHDRDQLLRAARALPDGQRAVLVLRFFDDLSVEDSAAALGCSTGTVKSQTSRALAALRAELDPSHQPIKEISCATTSSSPTTSATPSAARRPT